MKTVVALAVALVGLAGEAQADCLVPMQGVVEASFEVKSCRTIEAPRPDKRTLARIRVANLTVRIVPDVEDGPEVVADYGTLVSNIRSSRAVFVEASPDDACASFQRGRQVVSSVQVICCDTIPHKGLCALPGPLVRPN